MAKSKTEDTRDTDSAAAGADDQADAVRAAAQAAEEAMRLAEQGMADGASGEQDPEVS